MRHALVLLALAGCRQALGIPGEGTSGEDLGFHVEARVRGAIGATDGAFVLVNNTPEPITDGDITLATALEDGDDYVVESAGTNCRVTNGSGTIAGANATGVMIDCDGLAALGTLGFSAPIDPLDPSIADDEARGSILTQETYLLPAPLHPDVATITNVVYNGAPQPTTARSGPFLFAENRPFVVNLDGASFPRQYTIRPIVDGPRPFGYGKPTEVSSDGNYGAAVAAARDVLVVGAPDHGNGRAYIYRRDGREWVEQAAFEHAGPMPGRRLGTSVAVSEAGDRVVIGAPGDATTAGAAFVYTKSGDAWALAATHTAPAPTADDDFGRAVAITQTHAIVGCPRCSAAGVVYEFSAGAPVALALGRSGDRFGASLAVHANTLVIGAPGDDSATRGNPANADNPDAGAAYVLAVGVQAPFTYLKADSPGSADGFGSAVAIHGAFIVVGAPLEDGGSNAPPDNNTAPGAGAAYLFGPAGAWPQRAYIKAPVPRRGDNFGHAVAILGNTVPGEPATCVLAIAAPYEDSASATDQAESAPDAGAVFGFRIDAGGALGPAAIHKASNVEAGDALGVAIALTPESLVAGAPFEDSSTAGWNATPNEVSLDAGAVYSFR